MDGLTQKGIQSFKSGEKTAAQNFFKQALQENPADETAWLWLAGTFEDKKTRILCLEKVLRINPDNLPAQKGLAQLKPAPLQPPTPAPEPPPPSEPQPLPSSETLSPAAILADDDLWTDEPENTNGMFFDNHTDTNDIFGGMSADDSPLTEDVLIDTPFPEPKPVVQEGIILPDGSSARVSRDEVELIDIAPSQSRWPDPHFGSKASRQRPIRHTHPGL